MHKMIKNLGLPYMGSKRKLAPKIMDKIMADNPNCKYFFDLFGGGGAVSFEAMQRGLDVTYNELNAGVVALLRDVLENGVAEKYYQWVSRDTFHAHKNDDDWFGGLCKVVWSFGNNQKCYLFGKCIEDDKHIAHNIVVGRCESSRLKLGAILGIDIPVDLFDIETVRERRLEFRSLVTKCKERFDLQRLQRLQQLEQLERLERLEQLQQLLQLQHLERLQQLQHLERLRIINGSFTDVIIDTPIDETVVYLDPPYFNTTKYAEQLCYESLTKYINESEYKIYVSSYEFDLPCIAEFEHRSTLCATANNKVLEKLFCNKLAPTIVTGLF